jgi:hypothetical protein
MQHEVADHCGWKLRLGPGERKVGSRTSPGSIYPARRDVVACLRVVGRKKRQDACSPFLRKRSKKLLHIIPSCLKADASTGRKHFFLKRSKNFCPFGVRVVVTLTLYEQEFFGSFLQKRTACFLLFAASTGRLW